MDTLLRRCNGNHFLRGVVRVRPGAGGGRRNESDDRIDEAVRLDMQLEVVRRHVHHTVPEQEGSVRGEDHPVAARHLLPRVYRLQHVRGSIQLHPDEVREPQQAERPEGNLHPPDVRHRHQQHPVRVRRRLGRDHQEQPQGLRTVLKKRRVWLFCYVYAEPHPDCRPPLSCSSVHQNSELRYGGR